MADTPDPTPHTNYIRFVPGPRLMLWMGRIHTWLYRLTGGWIGARADRLDMLLLTTTGRKSGVERTTPLPYFRDGERYVLVGSNGGSDKHPAWVINLRANPGAKLQVWSDRFEAIGHLAEGAERDRIWKDVTSVHTRYADYQTRTDRPIQLAVFERTSSA